jgi:hypothetical protein
LFIRGDSLDNVTKLRGIGDRDLACPERVLSVLLLSGAGGGAVGDDLCDVSPRVLLAGGVSPPSSRPLFCGIRSTSISPIAAGAAELLEGALGGAAVAPLEGPVEELAAAANEEIGISARSASTTRPALVEAAAT